MTFLDSVKSFLRAPFLWWFKIIFPHFFEEHSRLLMQIKDFTDEVEAFKRTVSKMEKEQKKIKKHNHKILSNMVKYRAGELKLTPLTPDQLPVRSLLPASNAAAPPPPPLPTNLLLKRGPAPLNLQAVKLKKTVRTSPKKAQSQGANVITLADLQSVKLKKAAYTPGRALPATAPGASTPFTPTLADLNRSRLRSVARPTAKSASKSPLSPSARTPFGPRFLRSVSSRRSPEFSLRKLRRTSCQRSPGGTPEVTRDPAATPTTNDHELLKRALVKKFETTYSPRRSPSPSTPPQSSPNKALAPADKENWDENEAQDPLSSNCQKAVSFTPSSRVHLHSATTPKHSSPLASGSVQGLRC